MAKQACECDVFEEISRDLKDNQNQSLVTDVLNNLSQTKKLSEVDKLEQAKR